MNRFWTALAATLLSLALSAAPSREEARLLRFPATNGTDIVFTYAGDLYTVPVAGGQARRLTSHVGYEMFARYSPDGKTIAFTGEYDGNREVYIIPAEGGEPVRLTYTATNSRDDLGDRMGPNNIVIGWHPDGKHILYRNRIGDGFPGKLWMVDTEGNLPEQVPLPEGGFASWSLDGNSLAYNRTMREFRTWKYYRGGQADEVWIFDTKAGKVTPVTDNPAQDIFPMWVGDEIYFASDRDMTMNLFVYDTRSGKTAKVTDFREYDVKFPSTDGRSIVFENGGWIYRLDPTSKKAVKVPVTLSTDAVYARAENRNVSDKVTAASLSPDGRRIAVTARGEVFDVPAQGEGVTRNITRSPGANDRGAVWSPDGKKVAYISDLSGETEVWVYEPERGEARQLTKKNDTYIRSLQWSPDSRRIYYGDRKNRFVSVDPDSGKKTTVLEDPDGEFRGVSISPDSRYLAYTRTGANEMAVVYIYDLDAKKEYPVTEKWYNSSFPLFSSDGKYLLFNSDRDLNPIYSRVEWNYAYTNMSAVYMVMLAADTPSPFLTRDGEEGDEARPDFGPGGPGKGPGKGPEMGAAPGKGPGKDARPEKGPDAEKPAPVKIDPDGITARMVKVPMNAGGPGGFGGPAGPGGGFVRLIHCDGKKLWYSSGRNTNVLDFATGRSELYAEASMTYRPGDKKALFTKGRGGEMYVAAPGPGKAMLKDRADLSHVISRIDYSAEWPQIFDEVWRAFRDGFYLENMHGVDWKAVRKKYEALLPYARTRLDLNYIIGEMIGELACGHAYVTAGEKPEAPRVKMGLLGAEISRDRSGFFRIDRILPGDVYSPELFSPLTEPGVGVKEGEFITAVDGISVTTVKNLYQLLAGKAGVPTELTVNASAAEGGRKVVVRPIDNEYPLYHLEWVKGNIRKVEEATQGRVGYIYIPDMGVEGLNEFARYYYPQLDKEGLIIDDRENGGGNVSPMIIERLQREAYRLTMRRGSTRIGTEPEGMQHGPKVLLMNKYSASDGDLFPWSFKATGLGKTIGTRTWGGIIGISGSLPYMDGTDVRVPFFTNYDAATGEWIVENHGVDPDIVVDNDPVREFSGEDQQLDKAIEVILEELKTRKPLPGVPKPRTFKDLDL